MGRFWDRVKSLLGTGAERKWAAELDRVIADLDTMPAPAPPPLNPAVIRLAAEQQEEIRTGIADGLRHGGTFRQIMQEAATYGVKPEEVAAIREQVREGMEEGRVEATGGIRPLTRQLVECCQLDVWPGRAAVIDFGLDSSSHLGALQYAIREDLVTLEKMDAAMGDGRKLTEIAQRGDNPYRFVTFNTAWDKLRDIEQEHEHEGMER
jgi:hypothetical protein